MNLMVKMGRVLAHVWTSTGRIAALVGVCLFAAVGFAAESITITARPRYPWNGKVDLKFTIDGTSGTKYDTSFTAKDAVGGTNLTMKTLTKSDGTAANVAKEQLLPGTYNWVWDATADLGEGTVLEKVVVEGKTKNNEADAKRYMVVDLKSGAVSYLSAVPSGGWTDNPYKQTKWVFQRIEAGTFEQTSGTSSKRKVTITKPFYLSLHSLTCCHCNNLGVEGTSEVIYPENYKIYWTWGTSTNPIKVGDGQSGYGEGTWIIHYNLSDWAMTAAHPFLVPEMRRKTGLDFTFPTEAQLTLARKEVGLGSTWVFSQDFYKEDLGSSAVKDPCVPLSEAQKFKYGPGNTYVATSCVSGNGRWHTHSESTDSSDKGYYVNIRLCLEVK